MPASKEVKGLEALKEALMGALENHVAFTIPVLGGIPVADAVVVTWIVMAVWMILALALTRRLSVRSPGRVQTALEAAVAFLNGFARDTIGPHWRSFAPYLGTVALYIGLSNLIGIFGLTPPTKDISVTAALAVMSLVLIYGAQFRYNGLLGGLKKIRGAHAAAASHQPDGGGDPADGAVHAAVRQYRGRLYHYGAHQIPGTGGGAGGAEHLF